MEYGLVDVNSWTFLVFVPILMGFIPFLLDKDAFLESKTRTILFPIASVLIFLLIAFIARLEDFGCFIILIPPYLLVSVIISLSIRAFMKINDNKKDKRNITKNSLIFLLLPFLFGFFERQIPKAENQYQVSESIIIEASKEEIWNHLFSVPELTNYIEKSKYNYLGFPNPVQSVYDVDSNTRLGYFDNGVVLNESVIHQKYLEKLSFKINVEASDLSKSPTFRHVFENGNIVLNNISYSLKESIGNNTELTLNCEYNIRSNLQFYGEFWSKKIIEDFEQKLLKALRKKITEN